MTFVAGVLVLLQGVRMFLGEIIPAFKGISEKLIPGARPALDVPIFYASGPVATTVGFLCAMVGGILATLISTQLKVVVLPGVIGLFFMGGAAGVLIDVTGYGVEGLWFASTDAILVSVFMRLIGMIAGV